MRVALAGAQYVRTNQPCGPYRAPPRKRKAGRGRAGTHAKKGSRDGTRRGGRATAEQEKESYRRANPVQINEPTTLTHCLAHHHHCHLPLLPPPSPRARLPPAPAPAPAPAPPLTNTHHHHSDAAAPSSRSKPPHNTSSDALRCVAIAYSTGDRRRRRTRRARAGNSPAPPSIRSSMLQPPCILRLFPPQTTSPVPPTTTNKGIGRV